ncbi:Topoisomerase 1-associated factor 1 [Linnemannia exigua]|uniref:Topoisomerase 1-associated factor 1 n=1 Tax=Linnemannia exigua TaxID=604196 RepID=A0AAD4H480_9FUNG|nr:Topoisomerase 1-associated factor 1 [Linnemannia exigua]
MDPDTESLLVSTCLALGGFEDLSENIDDVSQVYVMGDECLECLKDIKKFIKYYEEAGDNAALTFLGKMNILEKDLIPIILLNSPADNSTKERLVLACIELMVPMTWIIDYEELKRIATAEEDDSIVGNLYEKNEILRGYKKAFLQPGVLGAIFAILMRPLEVEYRVRTTRDTAIIRLGLSLFRNLVAIRDSETSLTGSMEQFISSIMQDQLLERFQQENIMALLVTLASSSMDAQLADWNSITMEIFYYIFTGVEPEELLPAVTSSGSVRNSSLEELLQKEEREKQAQSTAGRKRHDRFGTTGEARLTDGRRVVLHQKGALFSSIDKQLDSVKKAKAKTKRQKESDEFTKTVSRSGAELLRNIALTILESCFNPLFSSISRDIEQGREKIKPHHRGQYHVLMTFLLRFRRLYVDNLIKQPRQDKKDIIEQDMKRLVDMMKTFLRHEPQRLQELKAIADAQDWEKLQQLSDSTLSTHQRTVYEDKKAEIMRTQEEKLLALEVDYLSSVEPWDFDLVAAAVEKTIVFQTIRYMREIAWSALRKAMDCFQEMLVTLNGMYKSPKEEYRDASDNVQNNLYYEEGTLELFLDLVKGYKSQSPKYLMTLIRMNHSLLKTLETYSQEKSFMAIKKKRNAMRKKKNKTVAPEKEGGKEDTTQTENQDGGIEGQEQTTDIFQEEESQPDNDQGSDEEELIGPTYREHRFVFKDFEARYANERVLDTYCTYLENYAELNETQLRYVASMFYRMAINCANMPVFYKASTLQLFHQILDSGLVDPSGDLIRFIYHLLRQFFKKLKEYPLLIVDVFAPKSKRGCLELVVGRLEAEKADLAVNSTKEKRLMATELEIDSQRPEEEQIKIAVMALYDEDKSELVDWAIEILKEGIVQRELMTLRTESELAENPDLMHSVEGVEDIPIKANTPARQKSLRIEPRFRLLLKLVKFTRDDSGDDFQFKIPKDLPTDTMVHYQEIIESVAEFAPNEEAIYDFAALITKTSKPSSSKKRSVGGSRVMAVKEAVAYHSAEYVVDSEDEDDDYFAGEQAMRDRTAIDFSNAEKRHREMIENNERTKAQKQREANMTRRREKKKSKAILLLDDENENGGGVTGGTSNDDAGRPSNSPFPPPRKATVNLDSDSEDDGLDTLEFLPKSTSDVESGADDDDDDDDDDDRPSQATPKRVGNVSSVSSRRLIDLDDSEDDDEQATQPLPVPSRSSIQTNKRRIILEDSDEDDYDRHSTQGSPAKKRHAFEE